MSLANLEFFVSTPPGMEPLAAREMRALGLQPAAEEFAGGVAFSGQLVDMYRANLHLRSVSRVLMRLGSFHAAAFSELETKASRLDWAAYLPPGRAVSLRVTCHQSRLYHSDGVAERVVSAIGMRLGQAPTIIHGAEDAEKPNQGQLIVVRLQDDECAISLDTSGAHLHQRGYRLATGKAPLRETLAAAMLLRSGWEPGAHLLDPFCGAGTIVIEAALIARRIAPGRHRRFAFMDWPGFDSAAWRTLLLEADAQRTTNPMSSLLIGSDRDAGAIDAARNNAARAGVEGDLAFTCRSLSDVEAPTGRGWVVTNPPYGVRLDGPDLRNLYARFGRVLREHCPNWRAAIIAANPQLLRATGLDWDYGLPLENGGLNVRLVQTTIPAWINRDRAAAPTKRS